MVVAMSPYVLFSQVGASLADTFAIDKGVLFIAYIAVVIWSLAWKGVALWFAARNHQKRWFIVILILNTVGILEIVYLIWFRRDKREGVTQSLFNNPLPDDEEPHVAGTPAA